MRKNRKVLISTILALTVSGSIAAGDAVSATVTHAPTVVVVAVSSCASPPIYLV